VIAYAIIASVVILAYLLGRVAFSMAKQSGRDEALREVSDKAADIDHKRAEEMLKEKTVAQVIDDLNNGKF
jgi:hypothetical protein